MLQSGPDDHLFVHFSGHGADGILAFPSTWLTVKMLSATLEKMHAKRMYSQMTFYIDACESGSMAKGLDPKLNSEF